MARSIYSIYGDDSCKFHRLRKVTRYPTERVSMSCINGVDVQVEDSLPSCGQSPGSLKHGYQPFRRTNPPVAQLHFALGGVRVLSFLQWAFPEIIDTSRSRRTTARSTSTDRTNYDEYQEYDEKNSGFLHGIPPYRINPMQIAV